MKLYIPLPPVVMMRINIKQQGHLTMHLAVVETTQDKLIDWLKELIEVQNLSIFAKGPLITFEVREATGGINGKAKSFSFKGLTPVEVSNLILENLE